MSWPVARRFRRLRLPLRISDTPLRDLDVIRFTFDADESPPDVDAGHARRAAATERIEHKPTFRTRVAHEPLHEIHGFLGFMRVLLLGLRPSRSAGQCLRATL